MAKQNPEAKLRYLKDKISWPISKIDVFSELGSLRVDFIGQGNITRSEYFSDISRDALLALLHIHFPQVYGLDQEQDYLFINCNGMFMTTAPDLTQADSLIRTTEIGFEEIYSVKDTSGKILARYVSDINGTIVKL